MTALYAVMKSSMSSPLDCRRHVSGVGQERQRICSERIRYTPIVRSEPHVAINRHGFLFGKRHKPLDKVHALAAMTAVAEIFFKGVHGVSLPLTCDFALAITVLYLVTVCLADIMEQRYDGCCFGRYADFGVCFKQTNQLVKNVNRVLDQTMATKICLVKAMVFPAVMYGCESWAVKKAECLELMLLNCGVGEDS